METIRQSRKSFGVYSFSLYTNVLFILMFRHFTLKCLSIGTPKTINFPFVPNGKLMVLDVPIFEHIIIRL